MAVRILTRLSWLNMLLFPSFLTEYLVIQSEFAIFLDFFFSGSLRTLGLEFSPRKYFSLSNLYAFVFLFFIPSANPGLKCYLNSLSYPV